MSNYSRGADRERQVCESFRAQGYYSDRTAGSHGVADVWAARKGELLLVQVKSDRRSAFASFGPADRVGLLAAAEKAGATALLIWWPYDRQGPRWVWPHEWPSAGDLLAA